MACISPQLTLIIERLAFERKVSASWLVHEVLCDAFNLKMHARWEDMTRVKDAAKRKQKKDDVAPAARKPVKWNSGRPVLHG